LCLLDRNLIKKGGEFPYLYGIIARHYKKGRIYMELVALYLYNRIPIDIKGIKNSTFHNLKRNGWYSDARNNKKFTMLNKRIECQGKWFRALIRFEYKGIEDNDEIFELSIPTPFLVTECEPVESVTSARWKDNKTYHGKTLGSVSDMIRAGVPGEVIDEVFTDLKQYIQYKLDRSA
jgi:hypothetical protein